MTELLYFLFLRVQGAMFLPVLVLVVFSFWGWRDLKKRTSAKSWLFASLLAVVCWRIFWLASSGGRSDRYYMLWGAVGVLLLPPGIFGMIRWGKRLRLNRLPIPTVCWWLVMILTAVGGGIGWGLHNSEQKTFVPAVVEKLQELTKAEPSNSFVLLDATSEILRMNYLSQEQLPIRALPKLRPENKRFFGEELIPVWLESAAKFDLIFLFVRQSPQRELDEYFGRYFHPQIIADYPFRDFRYTLYQIRPKEVYSSRQLNLLRRSSSPETISVDRDSNKTISFSELFPDAELAVGNVSVETKYGAMDHQAWYWAPHQFKHTTPREFEVIFTLWPAQGVPIARKNVHVRVEEQATGSETLPVKSQFQPLRFSEIPLESKVAPRVQQVMFLGCGITELRGLKKTLPANVSLVNTDRQDACETSAFSKTLTQLLNDTKQNPYWSEGRLRLTAEPLDTLFLLLGEVELREFGGADFLWPDQFDYLMAQWRTAIREIKLANPELQIVLGLLPYRPRGITPANHYGKKNIDFYNQAIAEFNHRLYTEYGNREQEGIFLLSLAQYWERNDFSDFHAWQLTPQGQRKILDTIKKFIEKGRE